eukprot:6088570-Alexandrium_andersonii.AAC.1
MGLHELRHKVMRPKQARTEMEVARRMEERHEAQIELARSDPSYMELPGTWKMAAARGILTGKIKEHICRRLVEGDMQ